eukprot:TRINITY_DN8220_c0_g1_i1.p1 TRINITY_DN8220_c0_g1~~TRINITY_DN8220_c0_g1_i1.p1  ORF type:complete len:235 (+),score=27.94 TRINITY_DN8220_c0_g1_i1:71-775(+)
MLGFLREGESEAYVLRIRNTFIEWAAFPVGAKRRPSSSPPICRIQNTSIEMVQLSLEIKPRADASKSSRVCHPIPNALAERLPPQTSRCVVDSGYGLHPSAPQAERLPSQTPCCLIDDVYGLHPSHPLWIGQTRIMLRNLPCRCKAYEIENFIIARGGLPSKKWTMVMPAGTYHRNRGYAFITATDPATAMEIVHVLWQQRLPTRLSEKPLKLQPSSMHLDRSSCSLRRSSGEH